MSQKKAAQIIVQPYSVLESLNPYASAVGSTLTVLRSRRPFLN